MASYVRNILTKNYQNLIIGFKVTVKNIGDVFFDTQCIRIPKTPTLVYRFAPTKATEVTKM